MRALSCVALVVAGGLAGCFAPEGISEDPEREGAGSEAYWAAIESAPHEELTFRVVSRAGGQVEVAGYGWWPGEARDTVVLGLHGSGSNALLEWGPAGVPGYSFAHRIAASGRAHVGIDLPGYGGSGALEEAATVDDYVHVIAQVADHLRRGSYVARSGEATAFGTVVALGFSMGSMLAIQSQGLMGAFDGVAAMGWTNEGFRDEARACFHGEGPCPEGLEYVFVLANTDPRIVEWALSLPAIATPGTTGDQMALWWGCYACFHALLEAAEAAPEPQDAAVARVDRPVLVIQGLSDFIIEPTTEEAAQASFASTEDVTVVGLEETGHAVQHHLNHEVVYATLLEWLDARAW